MHSEFLAFKSKARFYTNVNRNYVWLESSKLHLKLRKQYKNDLKEKNLGKTAAQTRWEDIPDFWAQPNGWASLSSTGIPLEWGSHTILLTASPENLEIFTALFNNLMCLWSAICSRSCCFHILCRQCINSNQKEFLFCWSDKQYYSLI